MPLSAGALRLPLIGSCLLAGAVVHAAAPAAQAAALALFVVIGGLWLTQVLPLVVTALLVAVGAVVLGLAAPAAALSAVLQSSGASRFLAESVLAVVRGAPAWLVLAGVVAFVLCLTELVSNTASAALLLSIFLPTAEVLGLPAPAAAAIAIAASCAFMLPVATPPNAIVFATEQVPQGAMMRCGLWLNGVCIRASTVLAGWLWT